MAAKSPATVAGYAVAADPGCGWMVPDGRGCEVRVYGAGLARLIRNQEDRMELVHIVRPARPAKPKQRRYYLVRVAEVHEYLVHAGSRLEAEEHALQAHQSVSRVAQALQVSHPHKPLAKPEQVHRDCCELSRARESEVDHA